jgi:hypothetical protein
MPYFELADQQEYRLKLKIRELRRRGLPIDDEVRKLNRVRQRKQMERDEYRRQHASLHDLELQIFLRIESQQRKDARKKRTDELLISNGDCIDFNDDHVIRCRYCNLTDNKIEGFIDEVEYKMACHIVDKHTDCNIIEILRDTNRYAI